MDLSAWRAKFLRFWRSENKRVATVRDILVAGLAIAIVLGGLWAYAGQPFPKEAPLVVVESGSMMHGPHSPHPYPSPPFGRLGTIDPGDLVIVKDPKDVGDIETAFGDGKRSGYGGHGDVVVYRTGGTPIIHRAMLYIEASPEGCRPNDSANPCTYRIPETCNAGVFGGFVRNGSTANWTAYCSGSQEPIRLVLERDGLRLVLGSSASPYPCPGECGEFHSGFITKGDNNPAQDQPSIFSGRPLFLTGAAGPVPLDQIIGKARAELPWVGLVKLALAGNPHYTPGGDPSGETQWKLLRARAPWDEWVALFFLIGLILAVPPAFEFGLRKWREKNKQET